MVDDLLDLSRITRDKLELRRERIELGSVIRDAVEVSRPLADDLRHDLEIQLPAEPIHLDADPVRLTQVFGNLLNNACKYTPEGGRIALSARAEGAEVVFSVKDNGIGIAPEMLSDVFEMFTQLDRSLSRSQGGLGIGLTLVKRWVELHGGAIRVHSEGLGRGSEFVVRLPIGRSKSAAGQTRGPTGESVAAIRRRILVVDDNRDSADSLAKLLSLAGHETQTAYDGIEAVGAAQTFLPDLVLLDIGLPKLNGYEACRRIRELPGGERVVVVALTGWGQDQDRQKSKEAGFNAHLVKPVEYAALTKLLAECRPPADL